MAKQILKEKHAEIAQYRQDRDDIDYELRQVNRDYSNCMKDDFTRLKRDRSEDDLEPQIVLKKKVSSIVTVPKHDKSEDKAEIAGPSNKKIQSVINYPFNAKAIESEVKKRNKNMFNSLMTHLNKAKTKLESDKPILKQQEVISKKAEEISKQLESQVREQHIEMLSEQKAALHEKSTQLSAKIAQGDKEIEALTRKCYESDLSHHLYTQAEPRLFWKPQIYNDRIYQYKSSLKEQYAFLSALDTNNSH